MRGLFTSLFIGILTLPTQAQLASSSDEASVNYVSYRTGLEQKAFALINQYRLAEHLSPLVWSPEIAQVARQQSQDMSVGSADFLHTSFRQRMAKLKGVIHWHKATENFAQTGNSDHAAEVTTQMWLTGPKSTAAIRDKYNLSGIGVWINDQNTVFFTQIFVRTTGPDDPAPLPAGTAPDGRANPSPSP